MKFDLGSGLKCDLQALIDTRALIQANSGGGKSWVLRRLLEQTAGHVQQIVIDPEGEFASLRERFDLVLAAKHGGDTAADPRSAKLLAERLLELRVSAICDIYELKAHERIKFVRHFLEAMVDAPKALWHPVLVVVDEAHVFCPQQGEAESAAAVIDMATRGRKRGFCAVLATQRLSKLHKDAAAELNNKLIGRTGLDVDRKRAGEELGFTSKEQLLALRQLDPGHFFAFGPALSTDVVEVAIGPVQTTHPKAGSRIAFTAPPATDKIKAMLPRLADLPAEAEQKQKTEGDLRKELATARSRITVLERGTPARVETKVETKVERIEVPILKDSQVSALERVAAGLEKITARSNDFAKNVQEIAEGIRNMVGAAGNTARDLARAYSPPVQALTPRGRVALIRTGGWDPAQPRKPDPTLPGVGAPLKAGARRMLEQLAVWHPRGLQRSELGVLAGVQSSGGTFSDYLSALRTNGFIEERGSTINATEAGLAAAGDVASPQSTEEIVAIYRGKLKAGARRMLDILVARHPEGISRRELGAESGVDPSGGTFSDYLSSLRTAGLVDESQGDLRAAAILFPECAGARR